MRPLGRGAGHANRRRSRPRGRRRPRRAADPARGRRRPRGGARPASSPRRARGAARAAAGPAAARDRLARPDHPRPDRRPPRQRRSPSSRPPTGASPRPVAPGAGRAPRAARRRRRALRRRQRRRAPSPGAWRRSSTRRPPARSSPAAAKPPTRSSASSASGVLHVEGELLPGVPVSAMVVKRPGHAARHQIRGVRSARHARRCGRGGRGRHTGTRTMNDLTNPDAAPLPPATPRHRPALAERIYHLIYSRISNGDYPANQKLPPEKALARRVRRLPPDRPRRARAAARAGPRPLAPGRRQLRARGQDRAARLRAGRDDRRHPALLRVPHLDRDHRRRPRRGAPQPGGARRDRHRAVA